MEIIVRYNGNIAAVMEQIGTAEVEILTEQYAILEVTERQLIQLRSYPEIEYIEPPKSLLLEDFRSLQASCVPIVQNVDNGGLRGKGILIAVLDSGIDYQNPYFQYEDGRSRIVSLWDQTQDSGTPPAGFRIGSEYDRDALTAGLSPQQDQIGHGTAVAALALETAPEAELIVVKLASSEGYAFTKTTQVMRALKYVIEKAREYGSPVVVNISLGTNNGSHSGDSLFDTYIDEWARRWRTSIVVAAGNEGVAGRHAAGILEPYQRKEIEFQVSGQKPAISLQIWRSFLDPIQVGIRTPDGTSTGIQPIGPGGYNRILQGNEIILYYGEPNPYTISVPILIDIRQVDGITEGVWILELESLDTTVGAYNIWISADVELRREVFFLIPEENTTVTIPSVTGRTISVAAYDTANDSIADFSGRGYTRGDTMIKPDLAAPGVNIALPAQTGIRQLYNGTSMAAPLVAGCCAVMMEWGIIRGNDPDMFGERLKAFLLRGADRNLPGRNFPDRDWGYGKLCLEGALREAERYRYPNLMRQQDCGNRIIGEEFQDILYQSTSTSEITPVLPFIDPDCIIELYTSNNLVFAPADERISTELIYRGLRLSNIPMLYGLAVDQKAVDLIGSTRLAQPPVSITGQNVLIGIIDTGIEYRHPAFADEFGNTKIQSIWDQTVEGDPPDGFQYGTQYTREQIDEALQSDNPLTIVPVTDENGHGTYIAGIAAGYPNEQFTGAAPGAELIVVKLKPAKESLKRFFCLGNADLAYSQTDILQASSYIVREAERLNRPVVLLYALAGSFGPHDGNTGVERYLRRLMYYEGIGIIAAAGNEANKGHHTSGRFSGTQVMEKQTVEWNVDDGESGLCLMVWSHSPDEISVELTTPGGYQTGSLPYRQDAVYDLEVPLEQSELIVSYKSNAEGSSDSCILIRLRDPAPGIWKMELTGELIVNGDYNIWMTLSNWTRPDTRFLRPDPNHTVVMPATGEGSITIGGYDMQSDGIFVPSGRGIESTSASVKPDVVAPATGVFGPLGMDSYQNIAGTSAAAALAAGAAAQMLEWGIVQGNRLSLNTPQMRRYMIRGAERRYGIDYPNNEWGYGLLNVYRSLEY